MDTALRYYLHLDPSQLTDKQWAAEIARLTYIRQKEKGQENG